MASDKHKRWLIKEKAREAEASGLSAKTAKYVIEQALKELDAGKK